jgi:hypothetical protein
MSVIGSQERPEGASGSPLMDLASLLHRRWSALATTRAKGADGRGAFSPVLALDPYGRSVDDKACGSFIIDSTTVGAGELCCTAICWGQPTPLPVASRKPGCSFASATNSGTDLTPNDG